MIEKWLQEIKKDANSDKLGMILIHNGIVRSKSKDGRTVTGMNLSYDKDKLNQLVERMKNTEGIYAIRVWINEGNLKVGDDIMYVLVAGRFRKIVIPVFEELVSKIKNEIVSENEYYTT
jgi:molybdopterin synthase catalytic subunit